MVDSFRGGMVNQILIKTLLILALIASIWYLISSSQVYSCDKCTITFSGSKSQPVTINMTDLYDLSQGNNCPVYWDRVWGYRIDGGLISYED